MANLENVSRCLAPTELKELVMQMPSGLKAIAHVAGTWQVTVETTGTWTFFCRNEGFVFFF